MRYVQITLVPESGSIGTVGTLLADESAVTRECILHINRLKDGSVVTLTQYRGDADRLETILEDADNVLRYDISKLDEGMQAYVHSNPTESTAALLELVNEHEFVLDTPIECRRDGGYQIALIGEERNIREVIQNIPEGIRVELERLSEYDPEASELTSLLTDRQQEILERAVELGYYEVPRRATHEDIADSVGVSTTTIGEHLRKIEARMLTEIAD
ncbi:MAG: helix-turn-helix domain-containing protein [Natronomonas sp.]